MVMGEKGREEGSDPGIHLFMHSLPHFFFHWETPKL